MGDEAGKNRQTKSEKRQEVKIERNYSNVAQKVNEQPLRSRAQKRQMMESTEL